MSLSEKANNVNWLMANFVRTTPGVEQAVAVSSDGLLIAMSTDLERGSADKMAAIITGIRALAHGAANELAKGQVMQVLVEMVGAYTRLRSHVRLHHFRAVPVFQYIQCTRRICQRLQSPVFQQWQTVASTQRRSIAASSCGALGARAGNF